jgi:hypothetical protein
VEADLRKENEPLYATHTKWFADEISADKKGTDIVISYLNDVAGRDESAADYYQYSMVKALFVAAVYSWHKDLLTFCEKIGVGRLTNAQTLSLTMAEDRAHYINAASLFGDVHRCTLLRATLTIGSILKVRPSKESSDATLWQRLASVFNLLKAQPSKESSDGRSEAEDLKGWRRSECAQRYYLLSILMDTAVKIAYIGCSTGWLKKVDEQRGSPQILVMFFESVGKAVERLRHEMKNAG